MANWNMTREELITMLLNIFGRAATERELTNIAFVFKMVKLSYNNIII